MRDKAAATLHQLSQYPVEQSFNLLGIEAYAGNWTNWYLANPLGIHISDPFLDRRLITYCLSLPREIREIPGVPKPLLQEAMKGILPITLGLKPCPFRTAFFWIHDRIPA